MTRRPTPAASLKVRAVPYTNGSQTNSPIPLSSWKPYNSFDSAVRNGSRVYRKDGTTYIISQEKVSNGIWKFSQKTEAQHGRQIIQNTNSGRRQRSSASYNPPPTTERKPPITDKEAIKVSRINRRGQQFHHIMDLDGYKHIYAGLDPKGRNQLNALLNKNGFYPGDDRRNYIGLVGSNVRKGSEHQGKVHPRTYAFRKTNPIPTEAQLVGLNPQQRVDALLPQLQQERSILQQVVKEDRRPNSNASPKPRRSAPTTPDGYSSTTKAALSQTQPPTNPGNLMRIARNTAPMWASLPLGAAVLGQSAHAAVTNPNADTVETALWDGANLVADGLSLVPIPMVAAGAEGAQKILGITQAARQGQKFVQQQGLTPQPPAPRPAAVPQAQSRPRTATAARTQGQMMPKPLDIGNEIEFRAKQVRGIFNRIFPPNRDT